MDYKARITQLRKIMQNKSLGAVLISNFENQYYFSGLKAITYSRPILMLVTKDETSLVLPTLEENHAKHKTDTNNLYVYHEVEDKVGAHSYHVQVQEMLKTLSSDNKVGIE